MPTLNGDWPQSNIRMLSCGGANGQLRRMYTFSQSYVGSIPNQWSGAYDGKDSQV